jgi:hypothetical protein
MKRNNFPSRETVESIRRLYPQGTRVEITQLQDPYSKLKAGSRGTVDFVDDAGSLFCSFDNGEHIGFLYGIDGYRKVPMLSNKAVEGLLEVRRTRRTNMLNLNAVAVIADELGYHETVLAIYDNKELVTHFIMTGEAEL